MSTWTGAMYGFYSNKPTSEVFILLKRNKLRTEYNFNYQTYKEDESLLFYENDDMLEHHLEYGYNTDSGGMGCFCVEAKKVNLNGVASLHTFEDSSDFEPYDINLAFNNIFYYVLILPDFVDRSKFSLQIHDEFKKILNLM